MKNKINKWKIATLLLIIMIIILIGIIIKQEKDKNVDYSFEEIGFDINVSKEIMQREYYMSGNPIRLCNPEREYCLVLEKLKQDNIIIKYYNDFLNKIDFLNLIK